MFLQDYILDCFENKQKAVLYILFTADLLGSVCTFFKKGPAVDATDAPQP
jgi:hypothetical protein